MGRLQRCFQGSQGLARASPRAWRGNAVAAEIHALRRHACGQLATDDVLERRAELSAAQRRRLLEALVLLLG